MKSKLNKLFKAAVILELVLGVLLSCGNIKNIEKRLSGEIHFDFSIFKISEGNYIEKEFDWDKIDSLILPFDQYRTDLKVYNENFIYGSNLIIHMNNENYQTYIIPSENYEIVEVINLSDSKDGIILAKCKSDKSLGVYRIKVNSKDCNPIVTGLSSTNFSLKKDSLLVIKKEEILLVNLFNNDIKSIFVGKFKYVDWLSDGEILLSTNKAIQVVSLLDSEVLSNIKIDHKIYSDIFISPDLQSIGYLTFPEKLGKPGVYDVVFYSIKEKTMIEYYPIQYSNYRDEQIRWAN